MATPFADPRTGQLYFRRAIPAALRAAFDGKGQIKVSLRTKDPAEAKLAFARENAAFEEKLTQARRRLAEGTLLPTPGSVVKKWCDRAAIGNGLAGPQRLALILMELDAAAGSSASCDPSVQIFPPAVLGPPANTDWSALLSDKARFEALVVDHYDGNLEQIGSNWIRLRWHNPQHVWQWHLNGPIQRLRAFEPSSSQFTDSDLAVALLAVLDEKRPGDDDFNRARLAQWRPRPRTPRGRPMMRLKQLFIMWKVAREPRPQSAMEFEASVDDFIDFAGDIPVSIIDAGLLFDYRDEVAALPSAMPRADRALPFRARVEKHRTTVPKCAPPSVKKRVGAIQALLAFAFKEQFIPANVGVGIPIKGYTKKRTARRSFEDHELALLCASPLFVDPASWSFDSQVSDTSIFWIFLLGITTGARLEEIGQAAVADVKRDGHISYLDIDEYVLDDEAASKSVKNESSIRLVPIHSKLIEIGFRDYIDALIAYGHTVLFPDLKENSVGKRTKEASRKMNRIIDRHVTHDRRLVFHSTRHAFKAKGNDAGVNERILDQICGHAPVGVGAQYGSDPRIRTIYRELLRIDFSCIDWDRIAEGLRQVKWDAVLQAEPYRREKPTPDHRAGQ